MLLGQRENLSQEENDMLSPKLFINKSFDEIGKIIDKNKKKEYHNDILYITLGSGRGIWTPDTTGMNRVL